MWRPAMGKAVTWLEGVVKKHGLRLDERSEVLATSGGVLHSIEVFDGERSIADAWAMGFGSNAAVSARETAAAQLKSATGV